MLLSFANAALYALFIIPILLVWLLEVSTLLGAAACLLFIPAFGWFLFTKPKATGLVLLAFFIGLTLLFWCTGFGIIARGSGATEEVSP